MNTRTMIFGGSAALALLIGVAFFAAATETNDGTMLGETALGDMLRKGMDNGKGEVERAMDGECDPEDAEQAREQEKLQDGSCGDGPSEDGSGEMKQEQSQQKSEGSDAPEDADQAREQEKLQDGSCGDGPSEDGSGEMKQEQSQQKSEGSDAPEDAEQTREREQLKDGSCDDDASEDEVVFISSTSDAGDESKDRSGIQQHDRDRDQDNGGTGPEYRNGAV